jgi:hypothetical protein
MAKVRVEDTVAVDFSVSPAERAIMLATKIACPHCRKHLKISKPMQAGHRVLCSHCGRSFAALEETNGMPRNAVQAMPPAPRGNAAHGETVPEAAMSSPARSHRQALWIGLILGGLVLLLSTTLGLVLYFATRNRPAEPAGEMAATTPSEDDNTSPANPPDEVLAPPPPPTGAGREDPPPSRDPRLLPTNTTTEQQTQSWLPPQEQEQVNKAIDSGVLWLKKHQEQNGSWGQRIHPVGLAALPALTLLECGVKADEIYIQKAAQHVRKAIPTLRTTYELSLAILFLDRLGDPADKKLIQTCALRLVAGQSPAGGWTYVCPMLSTKEEGDLLTVMRARRPKNALDLFIGGPGGSAPLGFLGRDANAPLDKSIQGDPTGDSKLLPEGGAKALDEGGTLGKALDKDRPSPQAYKKALERLPAKLRNLPSLQPPQKSHKLPSFDTSDNSNTQFAILGTLAAGRHGVPLERVYALIVHRFHRSQLPDGRWNYNYFLPPRYLDVRPAMTGSGLLGLAVQYGLAADPARGKTGRLDDPDVEKGFKYLSEFIGKPLGATRPRTRRNQTEVNLYFLWTVERCGVLYNRRQIEGKDWYPWGVELLLDHQVTDGSWNSGGYFTGPPITAITDTCFALLFLKRANLAKDLTKKLEFFMEGKKLQTAP